MAPPHDVEKRKIRKRLIGLDGKPRINEINKILEELPGYNTGPYGEIKKWLREEIEKAKRTQKVKHIDWLGVQRQGDKQFVLVGSPNIGKSSLLQKLSGINIKIADYQFTTLKPIPAIVKLNGAQIQIVDLPGLIEGATDDKGGGKRLIGIVKNADGIIIMADLSKPLFDLDKVINELKIAKIDKKIIVVGNKTDLPKTKNNLENLKRKFPREKVIGISAKTGEGLEILKKLIWEITGLIRVYSENSEEPMILKEKSTIEDFTKKVHKKALEQFKKAVISGPSAKFPNQVVGLEHVLMDGDRVKVIT